MLFVVKKPQESRVRWTPLSPLSGEKAFCFTTFIPTDTDTTDTESSDKSDDPSKKEKDLSNGILGIESEKAIQKVKAGSGSDNKVIRANYLLKCKLASEADQLFEAIQSAIKPNL